MLLERVDAVTLENPISHDYSCLRTWLIPILLSFLSYNRHVELPQKIFECGDVVLLDPLSSTSTRVEKRLAAAICDRKVGYEDIQAYLYALLHNLGLQAWSIKPLNHPSFIEGRGASLVVEDAEVAMLGEIHPAVLARFELQNPTACFELSLTKLLELI
jgi:phenylalanyl-tRNA synthetase beta chain